MVSSKRALTIITIVVLLTITSLVVLRVSNSPVANGVCVRAVGYVLIVFDGSGMNDSKDHGVPAENWPILTVHNNADVRIAVCNLDSSQDHGLAMYDSQLVLTDSCRDVKPQSVCYTNFVPSISGNFTMADPLFSTENMWTQSGLLRVV